MQCAIAALPTRVAPACSARTPDRQQQGLACLLTTSGASKSRQAARQQLAARRQAAARGSSRWCLAVASTATYGAEWTTPKDAYLTVVRGD